MAGYRVELTPKAVVVHLGPALALAAMRRRIVVPWRHVASAEAAEPDWPPSAIAHHRGVFVPRVAVVGEVWHDGRRRFLVLHRGATSALRIRLRDSAVDEILLESDDAHGLAAAIERRVPLPSHALTSSPVAEA